MIKKITKEEYDTIKEEYNSEKNKLYINTRT
jgi:hypothetical protein